jgi:hypothetical protein
MTDPIVPEADAAEQRKSVLSTVDDETEGREVAVADEASEADAAEQQAEIADDDELDRWDG